MLAMLRTTSWLVLAAAFLVVNAHAVTVKLGESDGARVQLALHPGRSAAHRPGGGAGDRPHVERRRGMRRRNLPS